MVLAICRVERHSCEGSCTVSHSVSPSLIHRSEVVCGQLAACPSLSLPSIICAEPEDPNLAPVHPMRQIGSVASEPVRTSRQEEDLAEEDPLPVLQKAIVLFGMWSSLLSLCPAHCVWGVHCCLTLAMLKSCVSPCCTR